jgi:hypothetical protein
LSQNLWYVSGYKMGFEHPLRQQTMALFQDETAQQTMFRVVVKSNLTRDMADHLLSSFGGAFTFLDAVDFSGCTGSKLSNFDLRTDDGLPITATARVSIRVASLLMGSMICS